MELDVRVFFPELPAIAERRPHRQVLIADSQGRCEVFAHDTRTGTHRVVTARPQGTTRAAIDPSGRRIWWFDDDVADVGTWRTQPFAGGPDTPAVPGVAAGRPAGLAMALDGTAAVGVGDDSGMTVHLVRDGEPVCPPHHFAGYATLVDLSADGRLIAVAGAADAVDAVRIRSTDGSTVATLAPPAGNLWALGFSPRPDDPALLLLTESGDRYALACWRPDTGVTALGRHGFDTEITASWYPDGRRVLIRQDRHARSRLYETTVDGGTPRLLPTAAGSILAAAVQPDGVLRYVWTDSTTPAEIRGWPLTTGSRGHGTTPGTARPGPREVWADGPGGAVHALLSLPDRPPPRPTVFLLHGGPYEAAMDAYDPMAALLTSLGCAVARVNYRGSTGYGPAWRQGFGAGVGLTQLQDVAAVRAELVRTGVAAPDRTAVVGESWGGYLALLAAGVQPELWCGVAAVAPIADYVTAFWQTTPAVRALDEYLFSGTPEQVPDAYRRSSPITYAAAVRAPMLIMAGTGDPKCPAGQIETYAERLRRHGHDPELIWTGYGHEAHDAAGRVQVLSEVVRHVCVALGGRPAPVPAA